MKRSTLSAALAVVFCAGAQARNLVHVQPTQSVQLACDGVSPRPTAPPAIPELLKRQIRSNTDQTVLAAPDATCGYISNRLGAHYTCNSDYTCVFYTPEAALTGNVACCQNFNCATRLACVDYDDIFTASACDDGCRLDINTVKCSDTNLPYCNTVSFDGGYYDFWCNNIEIDTVQSANTAISGVTGRDFQAVALTDVLTNDSTTIESSEITEAPEATSVPTTEASSEPATSTSSGAPASESGQNGDGNDDGDDDGTPVGPIVGGVVGGVAAIGLGGLALWFFLIRRRRSKDTSDSSTEPTPSTMPAVPMQQHTPPSDGGYYAHGGYPPPSQSPPHHQGTQTLYSPNTNPLPFHQQQQQQHQQMHPQHQQQQQYQYNNGQYGAQPPSTADSSPPPGFYSPSHSPQDPRAAMGASPTLGYNYAPASQVIHEAPTRHSHMDRSDRHELA